MIEAALERDSQLVGRRPLDFSHHRRALLIILHRLAVVTSLRCFLRFSPEAIGFLALLVGEREAGSLRVVADGCSQREAGVLGVYKRPCEETGEGETK